MLPYSNFKHMEIHESPPSPILQLLKEIEKKQDEEPPRKKKKDWHTWEKEILTLYKDYNDLVKRKDFVLNIK